MATYRLEPEHWPMSVDKDGNGPVENYRDIVATVCWCGVPGCRLYEEETS